MRSPILTYGGPLPSPRQLRSVRTAVLRISATSFSSRRSPAFSVTVSSVAFAAPISTSACCSTGAAVLDMVVFLADAAGSGVGAKVDHVGRGSHSRVFDEYLFATR